MLLLQLLLTANIWTTTSALAGTIYVDNKTGADHFDGMTPRVTDSYGGPVRTLRKASQIARRGDIISLANTGTPYHQSLQLTGLKNSGYRNVPFVIDGNGATLSGACPVPSIAWKYERDGLWRFKPLRKGYYLLVRDGKVVVEQPSIRKISLMKPTEGTWAACEGSIYYQARDTEIPPTNDYSFAVETTGISLYSVRHVRIRNLTIKHFRVDGIGAHDLAKDIVLENVTCVENGRSGISVAGSSDVRIQNSRIVDNRRHSIRISELGGAKVDKSDVVPEPVIVD